MANNKTELGIFGENLAADYLERNGYQILNRNYKLKFGEIDIIAKKSKNVVFCEVKTREKNNFASPEDNVNFKKQKKLIKLAELYLLKNKYSQDQEWQIDVIAIEVDNAGQKIDIRHIPQAIFY